jgi:hypothetical protein
MTERCSVILHHMHYSCRLKWHFLSLKNGDKAGVANWLPVDFSKIKIKLSSSVSDDRFANWSVHSRPVNAVPVDGCSKLSSVVQSAALRSKQQCTGTASHKGRYTLSVKLSDFTVWRHTWREKWVNCAVLIGNNAGFRTVLSSRLSQTELRSSLRESHSKRRPCFYPPHHTHKKTHRTDQKTAEPDGKPVLCQRTFSSVFRTVFLHS